MNDVMRFAEKRDQYRRELRAEIADAARAIFVRDGFDGFSIRRLAEQVGCSPGAIYLHYASKDALFEALVEESFARLDGRLRVALDGPAGDPAATLRRALRIYVDWGLEEPDAYRIAFVLGRPADGPYATHPAFDVARALVRRCLPDAEAGEQEASAQAVWVAAHGVASLLIQRPTFPWVSRDELIDQVIDGAIAGVVSRNEPSNKGDRHGKSS